MLDAVEVGRSLRMPEEFWMCTSSSTLKEAMIVLGIIPSAVSG